MGRLTYETAPDGIRIRCRDAGGTLLPPDQWAKQELATEGGQRASCGPILRLLDEELCTADGDTGFVPADVAAQFTRGELSALGLPPPAPHELEIESAGNITDESFLFAYRWIRNGAATLGVINRIGCILEAAGERYTLLDPIYSIAKTMDEFNAAPPASRDERFAVWGELRDVLPDGAIRDGYLREMRILRADAFTLTTAEATDGSFSFSPVPVRTRVGHPIDGEGPDETQEDRVKALPEKQQNRFAGQFRQFASARSCYALEHGHYVVLPERVRKALETARRVLDEPEPKRRQFFLTPRTILKERLGRELDEETIEGVFFESAEYSERVRGIKAWSKPVIPFYRPVTEPWLPPEILGIEIGGVRVDISSGELPGLAKAMRGAIERGEATVTYKGVEIPVTPETVAAVESLVNEISPPAPEEHAPATPMTARGGSGAPIAIDIQRNIEGEVYVAQAGEEERGADRSVTGLQSVLLPHQTDGLRWLQDRLLNGYPGALLADDMGLGKTFQVLAFLKWLQACWKARNRKCPILVVGPTGLLKNWEQEHDQHLQAPGLGEVLRAHGSGLQQLRIGTAGHELAVGAPKLDTIRLHDAPWVLTTYETLRDYQHSFAPVRWGCVVFDEAQKIKNPTSLMTDAAKALRSQFYIGMTGTPVENRVEDLWCIVDTLCSGALGALKDFSQTYGNGSPDSLEQLKRKVEQPPPGLMLRRLKQDHLEGLPARREHIIDRNMPAEQAHAYRASVLNARNGQATRGQMLKAIQRFRSVSLHPKNRTTETDDEYINGSARLAVTFELLDTIRDRGEKCLIFLESLDMHGILAEIIQRRYRLPKPPMTISGSVAGAKRQARVNAFQSDPHFDVMILSPRAGGVGITLTAANNVIHLSRWWNPAVEDQCTDRVYRIGQNRDVNVYIPRAVHPEYHDHSFDIRLHKLLEHKRNLSRTLLAPPSVSKQDVDDLFRGLTES